jgi:hypothetical protein
MEVDLETTSTIVLLLDRRRTEVKWWRFSRSPTTDVEHAPGNLAAER